MPSNANQFQYQARALPVVSGPETVTVDRFAPTFPHPIRRLATIAFLTAGSFAPTYVPPLPPLDGWQPASVQPSRVIRYAAGTRLAFPELPQPNTTVPTPDGWAPSGPQPSRVVRYARGTSQVLPELPQPNATVPTADGWAPSGPQPSRVVRYARGTFQVLPELPQPTVDNPSSDKWATVFPQPSRWVRYAKGTAQAEPELPQPNAAAIVTPFREALVAHLNADVGLAALVSTRIYCLFVPQKAAFPAITYQVVSLSRSPRNLASPNTLATARVQITAHSRKLPECQDVAEAVRQCLQGFAGELGNLGVTVVETQIDDERDLFDSPHDGSGTMLVRTAVDYLIRYREPKPSRFG